MFERVDIMIDTQAIDVTTLDYKSSRVRCVVCGYTDCQMNFALVHNVSKC